jgi:hypothetical protein
MILNNNLRYSRLNKRKTWYNIMKPWHHFLPEGVRAALEKPGFAAGKRGLTVEDEPSAPVYSLR